MKSQQKQNFDNEFIAKHLKEEREQKRKEVTFTRRRPFSFAPENFEK